MSAFREEAMSHSGWYCGAPHGSTSCQATTDWAAAIERPLEGNLTTLLPASHWFSLPSNLLYYENERHKKELFAICESLPFLRHAL
jgi:hypothetical protein